MVRYISTIIFLLLLTTNVDASIEYNGTAVSAIKTYSTAWDDITPKAHSGGYWLALISYVTHHFFVDIGQSNACGYSNSVNTLSGVGGIEIKTNGTLVTPVTDPCGQAVGKFDATVKGSSWPAFAKKYAEISSKPPIILCLGAMAAGLTSDPYESGQWAVGAADLYASAKTHIDSAIATLESDGYKIDFKGFIFWQGETDGQINVSTAAYQAALETLATQYFSDYSAWGTDLNFYLIKIKNNGANDYKIRDADDNASVGNVRIKVAFENPYTGADEHHTQAEYDVIGEAVATYINEVIE